MEQQKHQNAEGVKREQKAKIENIIHTELSVSELVYFAAIFRK